MSCAPGDYRLSETQHAFPLILNKVASPHYSKPLLRRARLIDWMDRAANCRAVVVAADAGYGKTTLLWQWEREVQFPIYWYKLDPNDRDWTVHINYLVEAIAARHDGFGRRARSMLQQIGEPGSSRPAVAAYLLAEMHQRLTEPCTFVVDDWQFVNAVTEVRGLWNQILRDAPPGCRFVFASRVKPRLQFARFKAHGGYAELGTDALRFTEEEINELFRDVYNDPLDASELIELERRTEGWAASLQLVEVSLHERASADQRREFIRSITPTTNSALFEFLAEEVLDQQPEETRNFLLSTSILQQITPEVAERLAGVHDGRTELANLEHRGLFTSQLDDLRYRYHNLFRSFLERRLAMERSQSEVIGLHIHAASYFETTQQWPEAIHHYLQAKLHRQAARLIARYGEDVVAHGGLGMVDEWLRQLPDNAIRQNARLSLLLGEANGIQGRWKEAIEALERARNYFARKGDKRLEALACLKLSTVYSNTGNAARAADVAEAGVRLVPPDAAGTKLRLQGNLAITRTWLTEPADTVARECERIAAAASECGLEHIAAIGLHNAGEMQLCMGQIKPAIDNLGRAASFWAETPTNPFSCTEDLVMALLLDGQFGAANAEAEDSARRTYPWPRPWAHSKYAMASVMAAEERYEEAISAVRAAVSDLAVLGAERAAIQARLVEYLFLAGYDRAAVGLAATPLLSSRDVDPRYFAETAPARAIALHVRDDCLGDCQGLLKSLDPTQESRAWLWAVVGRMKIGALALEHRDRASRKRAWVALEEGWSGGYLRPFKGWVRRFAADASFGLRQAGAPLLADLADWDPEAWRMPMIDLLSNAKPQDRALLLAAAVRSPNRATVSALRYVEGDDVAAARRQITRAQAARLYLRTLGGISLRRGSWHGPTVPIDKRRVRSLLAVLAAHSNVTLTRDAAIDFLWPDADGDAAVNSLNQTVFQLRRCIDPDFRQGESPEYVISSSEQLALARDLVRTDLDEIAKLAVPNRGLGWPQRQEAASRAIGLVQGEFLADLKYEEWASRLQLSVHNDVRKALLPIATGRDSGYDVQVALAASSALVLLDPYDEPANLALADNLARTGRRVAARQSLVRFTERLRDELEEEPSPSFSEQARALNLPSVNS